MSATQIVLIAAVVILLIGRRFVGAPVGSRTLLLPLIMIGIGLVQLSHHHIDSKGIALLAIEAVIAVAAGLARAATIKLYVRDGHLWQRYSVVTALVWLAMIALRIGFLAAGHSVGANLPEEGTILLMFGMSMVIETLGVTRRALAHGAPIRPRQSNSRRGVGVR